MFVCVGLYALVCACEYVCVCACTCLPSCYVCVVDRETEGGDMGYGRFHFLVGRVVCLGGGGSTPEVRTAIYQSPPNTPSHTPSPASA